MLGIGPEGHVASLFPGQPALYEERTVVAVHGSPKPPPIRLTMTLPAIRTAREVWIIASGEDKSGAIRLALSGAGPVQVPAAGARGRQQTLFLLDRAAAARVPPELGRLPRPDARPRRRGGPRRCRATLPLASWRNHPLSLILSVPWPGAG